MERWLADWLAGWIHRWVGGWIQGVVRGLTSDHPYSSWQIWGMIANMPINSLCLRGQPFLSLCFLVYVLLERT